MADPSEVRISTRPEIDRSPSVASSRALSETADISIGCPATIVIPFLIWPKPLRMNTRS